MIRKLAVDHGVDKKTRTFSAWSHVVSLLYTQLVPCIELNDVCDSLRHHAAKLLVIRATTVPIRNSLSYANKQRNATMMEVLFWKMLEHLQQQFPGFGPPSPAAITSLRPCRTASPLWGRPPQSDSSGYTTTTSTPNCSLDLLRKLCWATSKQSLQPVQGSGPPQLTNSPFL